MRKFTSLIVLMMIIFGTNAQTGNNALSVNGEATIPFNQIDRGFGFFVKGSYGIGNAAQLTLSAGISRFTASDRIEPSDATTRLIPILIGYKQNIRQFFIEPQIGLGELGGRVKLDGDYFRPSVAAFFSGVSVGYTFKQFNTGIHFQAAHGIEGSTAGAWHNKDFHYTGIFIGFNLCSGK